MCNFVSTDFALATVVMIDESLPHEWFYRRGFVNGRMFLLFIWLFVGNVLSMGYRAVSILLVSLQLDSRHEGFRSFPWSYSHIC